MRKPARDPSQPNGRGAEAAGPTPQRKLRSPTPATPRQAETRALRGGIGRSTGAAPPNVRAADGGGARIVTPARTAGQASPRSIVEVNDHATRDPSAREAAHQAYQPGRVTVPERAPPRKTLPGAREAYCEVDGQRVEIEPNELSVIGLYVLTATPPPADREIGLFLRVGAFNFHATGCVVDSVPPDLARLRSRKPGYAVLFMHLEERTRLQLRAALEAEPLKAADVLRSPAPKAKPDSARPQRRSSPTPKPRASARPNPGSSAAPASAKPAPIDPKEREILVKLQAELAALRSQPPWSVLGISQGADAASARQAFFAASKRYHPHIYARYALPEIKQTVTELFIAYKRAFTSMTKSPRASRVGADAQSGKTSERSSLPGNGRHG